MWVLKGAIWKLSQALLEDMNDQNISFKEGIMFAFS